MEKIRLAFLLVLIVACSTTVKTENATDNFIFPINFKVNETQIPKLIIKSLNENTLDEYNLTVKDVMDIFEIEKLTLEEFKKFIEPLNLTQNETIDYLEKVVETLSTSIKVSDIRDIFIKDLNIASKHFLDGLGNFSLSDYFDNKLVANNNTAVFEELKYATFNNETFQNFLKFTNKSEKDIFDASKSFFVTQNITNTHISNLVNKIEINFSFLLTRPANTTIDSLNPLKEKLLEDFKSYQDSLAVATKEYNIITSKRIHSTLKAATMIEINLKIEERNISVGLENFDTKLTFAQIASINTTLEGFAVGTKKILENCTYITLNNNKEEKRIPLINETFDENQLMGHIEDKSDFKIGGPLICNEELYGIAEEINNTLIRFVNVNKDDKSKAASLIFNSFILCILCIVFRFI